MKFIGIIPARYSSTRLPGKPLAMIGDKPMIQHVYEHVSKALSEVWVATDDLRIADAVAGFGGLAVMTSPDHKTGTDRCAEVAMRTAKEDDMIINIQGDMPFISPESIKLLCGCFSDPLTEIATLAAPFARAEDMKVRHKVKVLVEEDGWVYNFSRSPLKKDIPGLNDPEEWLARNYKHIGIYGYRYDTLMRITKLPQSASELAENLEQLRWIANGYRIKCAIIADDTISVDTPEDLLNAVQYYEYVSRR
ncbi:MAG: 3-deoxy-manno-octulosonate cytidylyltransferase [Bacteroidales bacterium]